MVVKCMTDLIHIQLPETQNHGKHMGFKRAEDGLFYMEVILLPDDAEQVNSNRVVEDDTYDDDQDDSDDSDDSDQMLQWAHAIDDCTIVRNLQPRKSWLNAYEPFGEEPPVKAKDLIPAWGALGWMTVCTSNNIKPKWKPKAIRVP